MVSRKNCCLVCCVRGAVGWAGSPPLGIDNADRGSGSWLQTYQNKGQGPPQRLGPFILFCFRPLRCLIPTWVRRVGSDCLARVLGRGDQEQVLCDGARSQEPKGLAERR